MKRVARVLFGGRFWALALKELRQIRRDRRLTISLIVPPTLQVLLFGFALDSDVRNLPLGIVDESRTPESRELVAVLTQNRTFRLAGFYATPAILGDPSRMERIDRAYPGRCPRDLGDLFTLSRSFAGASGLVTPRVQVVLGACDRAGVRASMTMLGEGVFALGEEAAPVLAPFGKVYRLRIAERGFSRGEVAR